MYKYIRCAGTRNAAYNSAVLAFRCFFFYLFYFFHDVLGFTYFSMTRLLCCTRRTQDRIIAAVSLQAARTAGVTI